MLNLCQSAGAIIGMQLFAQYLTKVQTWKLIKISLWVQVITTCLMYVNLMRWNISVLSAGENKRWWSVTDWQLNALLMFMDRATFTCLAVVPMTIQMTHVIPDCIEASMFAIVSTCITFSSDWASDTIGAIFCSFFGITTDDMTNLPTATLVKIALLFFVMLFVRILPTNEEIHELSKQINGKDDDDVAEESANPVK